MKTPDSFKMPPSEETTREALVDRLQDKEDLIRSYEGRLLALKKYKASPEGVADPKLDGAIADLEELKASAEQQALNIREYLKDIDTGRGLES